MSAPPISSASAPRTVNGLHALMRERLLCGASTDLTARLAEFTTQGRAESLSGGIVYFRITADSVELAEPQNVTDFYATCPATLGHDDLVESVRRADLGELLPDDRHLMIRVDAIRRMAADRVGPEWSEDLRKMIDYAASKGWTDEDGTLVRAHLERR